MKSLKRFSEVLGKLEDVAAGGILAAVLGIVVFELVGRGAFGRSNLWTDELSRVLLIAMTYVSAVGLTRDGAHVRVELFVDKLSASARIIAERVTDAACLAFALTATWLGFRYVQESALFGISFAHSDLPFPIWMAQAIIPVCFALMSLRLLLRIIGIRPEQPVASVEA
ncbi:2,3-diketo-L-gulonate TRAP transporter small permease protein YiaM [Variibacter gotjawalensis]|uniref:TRAP transporter small permease protein n=1 Tax=Variibacter gotjawalensis TaxID=1333996 RepID=A0A0S3PRT1_9BRAD|nr:TRAP transporter small permease [Variibacter gotjawalensis]NIK48911.1 TRAP-type C4-dicarboxylate transport system permease small subunit [Variibacter gotjawalensis]RZS50767.1 TRAP-type C4-dicarboxylate transport system permease small subunit [Variibacter gotjawalensis]BAT58601.1 2,3-diketo-L-gulonate TRAP transporter small permease protein YiaM [Variibacter gotjawalensis]